MTSAEFEKVYAQYGNDAVKQAMAVCRVGRSRAEDALQNAAVYCLEHLDRLDRITKSYFCQLVINNARMIGRSETARELNRERGVGDWFEVAGIEAEDAETRVGRTPPAQRCE